MDPDSIQETDPFLLDADGLQGLASKAVVRRGIAYFKEQRVTQLGWDAERLWANVEGSLPGGYQVEILLDDDREMAFDCQCPFDWEPACKHVVAALLAYGARQPTSSLQVASAADAAVDARIQRGRFEVAVKHVAGDRWLGTWEARSLEPASHGRRPWRVELRSVRDRINSCSCPDFASNRLGTCKHIESVIYHLRKRAPTKFARHLERGPAVSIVYLAWDVREAPQVRLMRAQATAPAWLDEHFDGAGSLRDTSTRGFERFEQAAREDGDVIVTGEVRSHVERRAEEHRRRAHSARLAAEIRAGGGTLAGVQARLYPYQVEGVATLASTGRALLADDMGLGKTLQAIAAAVVMRRHQGVHHTLVICPASLKHQWAREVERFTRLDGVVVEGPPAARLALYRRRAPFTFVNYEIVLRDQQVIQAELSPDLLILDEAQRIKNWRTKTAGAVKALETPFAFVLTGTPLENRLEDLYSLMQVIDPRVLGPLWSYLLEFHVTDDRGKVLGYRNLHELRRRLEPVMLRRDKTLVRDQLPARIVNRVDVELDRRQRQLHDEALSAASAIASRAKERPLTPAEEKRLLVSLQSARMACDAAGLVDRETVGSPKLAELKQLLEQLCVDGGRKAVVFSEWKRMVRMAEEQARSLGLGTVTLHGGVPTARRGALIDRFREDPAVQVFFSTDAGGVGLNLQAASVLINLDLPWNPAVLEQRIGRVYRLGQQEPVQIVQIVARESYEERIAELLLSKRELFRHTVTADASEDVVGVSKRQVETAMKLLHEGEDAEDPSGATGEQSGLVAQDGAAQDRIAQDRIAQDAVTVDVGAEDAIASEHPSGSSTQPAGAADSASLAPLVGRLQAELGGRLEQIVAFRGALVVVTDELDEETEARARSAVLDETVAVEVMDRRSWAAIGRLGVGSPVDEPLFERTSSEKDETAPLLAAGRRKLSAARTLADAGHAAEALSLAAVAMVHGAASAAGLEATPPLEEVAVWLYSEVVPKGLLDAGAAAGLSRALALTHAPAVPPDLLQAVLSDAAAMLADGE